MTFRFAMLKLQANLEKQLILKLSTPLELSRDKLAVADGERKLFQSGFVHVLVLTRNNDEIIIGWYKAKGVWLLIVFGVYHLLASFAAVYIAVSQGNFAAFYVVLASAIFFLVAGMFEWRNGSARLQRILQRLEITYRPLSIELQQSHSKE